MPRRHPFGGGIDRPQPILPPTNPVAIPRRHHDPFGGERQVPSQCSRCRRSPVALAVASAVDSRSRLSVQAAQAVAGRRPGLSRLPPSRSHGIGSPLLQTVVDSDSPTDRPVGPVTVGPVSCQDSDASPMTRMHRGLDRPAGAADCRPSLLPGLGWRRGRAARREAPRACTQRGPEGGSGALPPRGPSNARAVERARPGAIRPARVRGRARARRGSRAGAGAGAEGYGS